MKHLSLNFLALVLSASVVLNASLSAQTPLAYAAPQSGLAPVKDSRPFKDRLWYGGGLTLGFSAGNDGFGRNYSLFGFGISPMVGYKIVGPLSAGPRLSILYTSQKYTGIKTFNLFDIELSLFARVRIYKGLFFQGELGTISDQYIFIDSLGQLGKETRTRPAQYLGLGYNFSNGNGGPGQEIAIMYDFYIGNDINAYEQPWQYRLAFTYGF